MTVNRTTLRTAIAAVGLTMVTGLVAPLAAHADNDHDRWRDNHTYAARHDHDRDRDRDRGHDNGYRNYHDYRGDRGGHEGWRDRDRNRDRDHDHDRNRDWEQHHH